MTNIILFALGFALLFPSSAAGETANAYQWISQLGPMTFNKGGAANVPGFVLGEVKSGNISPIMQFVLANTMMNKCIKDTYKDHPMRRDPFKVASGKFSVGLCRVQKCFQQAMLMGILPQLSGKKKYGGQQGQESGKQMGAILAQTFKQDDACPGGDQAMSGILMSMFLK